MCVDCTCGVGVFLCTCVLVDLRTRGGFLCAQLGCPHGRERTGQPPPARRRLSLSRRDASATSGPLLRSRCQRSPLSAAHGQRLRPHRSSNYLRSISPIFFRELVEGYRLHLTFNKVEVGWGAPPPMGDEEAVGRLSHTVQVWRALKESTLVPAHGTPPASDSHPHFPKGCGFYLIVQTRNFKKGVQYLGGFFWVGVEVVISCKRVRESPQDPRGPAGPSASSSPYSSVAFSPVSSPAKPTGGTGPPRPKIRSNSRHLFFSGFSSSTPLPPTTRYHPPAIPLSDPPAFFLRSLTEGGGA